MTLALADFETSICPNLLSIDELVTIKEEGQFQDALSLARELVSQRKLTRYQAFIALRGNASDLDLGRYLILDELGKGGMGQVYLAKQLRLDRDVAVKMLVSDSSSEWRLQRFAEEIRLCASMFHPNIVAIFDADRHEERDFFVMEYVPGMDLREAVQRRGKIPLHDALSYCLQVATGLRFAHSLSIIHRDIKPSNLLVTENGDVKITDFGLGKRRDAALTHELTVSGDTFGTLDFMAPEQAENAKSVDHRADLYSLGCTLHYLLTSEPIYRASNIAELILSHREKPIPNLSLARLDIPSNVNDCFQLLVAKQPSHRFSTTHEAEEAIRDLVDRSCGGHQRIDLFDHEVFSDASGIKFVHVKAGEFVMGSNRSEDQSISDRGYPAHRVELTEDFYLSCYPISQSEYERIMRKNPSANVGNASPVECVSWVQAIEFVNRLSDSQNIPRYYKQEPDGHVEILGGSGYRLPTEAEWEFAARGGTETTWHFGENAQKLGLCAWISTNSDGHTHEVGLKMANQYGLYDMYGNVWEWCWDRYDELFYGYSPRVDPIGPQYGNQRVIRGGSFAHVRNCCSTARSGIDPQQRSQNVGLRIAKTEIATDVPMTTSPRPR